MKSDNYEYLKYISLEMVKERLPHRISSANKGTFGTLMCLCGSFGMSGAAYLSIASAQRCGVGKVFACIPKSIYEILAKQLVEPIFFPLDENDEQTTSSKNLDVILEKMSKCTSCLIGCGLGWNDDLKLLLHGIIKNAKIPLIIDADGINIISDDISILDESNSDIILTPHVAEMARLLDIDIEIEDVKNNRMELCKKFSIEHGVITVLKGEHTIISDKKGNLFMNKTGNSGMAKAGCGDVLSGMIGSMLAQRLKPIDATICAVHLHGLAGDRCMKKLSNTSMQPTDIIYELSELFSEIEQLG